ncbi:MAG: (2Fe-2S)-binding protein [Ignavibacteriae bacterium HGW-Ignavibacteriae-2]|nr:MAG: (2Fe-2S)-binding protein [Ignavibacteriae bacterium HGW-Ignavibacteriae-2]
MKEQINFILNDKPVSTTAFKGLVLLDFLRKEKRLTGTKEVCKEGDCGACAIVLGELINGEILYKTVNSCLYPLGNVEGKHVVTIEGLNQNGFTPIQKYIIDESASQCGFCTPGFIISLTTYFLSNKEYDIDTAIDAIGGNICRCTGYLSIKRSVAKMLDYIAANRSVGDPDIDSLIRLKIIPEYFKNIHRALSLIDNPNPIREKTNYEKIIGGGTDLYVQQADSLLDKNILFVGKKNRSEITLSKNEVKISGSITFEEFNQSSLIKTYLPQINDYMKLIASLPIRNTATLAGNIINASPIGDMSIILLALDSRVVLTKGKSRRKVFLKDLYKGYKSLDRSIDELVSEIRFKIPGENNKFNFEKVSKRTHLDIATVNSAINLVYKNKKIFSASLSFGGVAPVPLYLKKTSEYLVDKEIDTSLVIEIISIAQSEISPITDIRGSVQYKRLLVSQIIKKHFITLFPELISHEVLK